MSAGAATVEIPADLLPMVAAFFHRYRQLEELEADWRERAACAARTVPPLRWFFPDATHQVVGAKGIRRARRACALCPVRRTCLGVAMLGDHEGIWAATTTEQRRATAHMEPEMRLTVLERMAYEACVVGPWRVASEDEWRVGDVAGAA